MNELLFASATQIAKSIKDKIVSSEEIVRAHIDHIQSVNPAVNAVVQLVPEQAIAQAKIADKLLANAGIAFTRSRGKEINPLHGVPMTIKDSFDTEDIVTTWGTLGNKNYMPDKDATAVRRLRESGAIIIGKTNTPELTRGIEMTNLVYGRSYNPYALDKSPGGSSGGAAAALAMGCTPIELGSDTGGSIRQPASYCGVCGIKPTFGSIPRTGHAGASNVDIWDSLTCVGPMARYVQDLELMLPLLTGPDDADPMVTNAPQSNGGSGGTWPWEELRVGWFADAGVSEPISEISSAVKNVAMLLKEQGAIVRESYPPMMAETANLFQQYEGTYLKEFLLSVLEYAGTTRLSPSLFRLFENSPHYDMREKISIMKDYADYKSDLDVFMQGYDIIICPVTMDTAPIHGNEQTRYNHNQWYLMYAFNLTGWPAAVVCGGRDQQGLPFGIQIVGKPWQEHKVLTVAKLIQDEIGGFNPPDLGKG